MSSKSTNVNIGQRKYHRALAAEGTCILGMVGVNTHDLRLPVCHDNRRDEETLLCPIDANVERATTLYTDCWKGYTGLSSEGFQHTTVNHEYHFVDHNTSATTNHTEPQWRPLQCRLLEGVPLLTTWPTTPRSTSGERIAETTVLLTQTV